MAAKNTTPKADRKTTLLARIEGGTKILAKLEAKPKNDPKRRLAAKKLKRSHRLLARALKIEKRAAEAAAKGNAKS